MCGEASVTQQYAQVRWDSFAVEVLDSLYSTAPVSMHCNQSDARPFPVSPSQTSSSQLGRKHLKKRIYMFLFFLFVCFWQGDWDKQPLPEVTSTLGKPLYPCEARGPPCGATPTPPV